MVVLSFALPNVLYKYFAAISLRSLHIWATSGPSGRDPLSKVAYWQLAGQGGEDHRRVLHRRLTAYTTAGDQQATT
jgi:hypothetical protein